MQLIVLLLLVLSLVLASWTAALHVMRCRIVASKDLLWGRAVGEWLTILNGYY